MMKCVNIFTDMRQITHNNKTEDEKSMARARYIVNSTISHIAGGIGRYRVVQVQYIYMRVIHKPNIFGHTHTCASVGVRDGFDTRFFNIRFRGMP